MIPGLFLERDWITSERERDLVLAIGEADRRHKLGEHHRTVARYGPGVKATGYTAGARFAIIPSHLECVRAELMPMLDANAITVAWYAIGDGIAAHVDKPGCGEVIAIVSLMGDATMRMSRLGAPGIEYEIPRRSLTILRGEARHEWMHEILPVISPRIAIVFRQATL